MHFKVSGKYRLQVVRPDGTVKQEAEFDNLVTDAGLNRMGGSGDYLTWCQVGTGSTAPTVADTALASRVAGSSTTTGSTAGTQPSSPYYTWRIKTFSFPAGTAAGNLAEVGVGWSTTGNLFSRALILDSGGSPTTITVLSDETLYVTYEVRLYPSSSDNTGDVTFTGNIAGTYDYTWRASNVNTASTPGWFLATNGSAMNQSPTATAYSGTIGSVTAVPSGTSASLSTTLVSYSNNSLEARATISASLSQANISGIRSIRITMGPTTHQVQFDPAIPKTASDTLNLVVAHTWGRV